MEYNRRETDDSVFGHFLKYQAVYAVILSFVISYTLLGARLTSLEKDTLRAQIQVDSNKIILSDVNSRLASIETSLEFIKVQLK